MSRNRVLGDFLKEFTVFFAITILVVCAFQTPRFLWVFLSVVIAARFFFLNRRGDCWVFLAGAIAGGGDDCWMVWQGICRYSAPTLLPVAFPEWMFLFWGEVFLVLSRFARLPLFRDHAVSSPFARNWTFPLDLALLLAFQLSLYLYVSKPGVLGIALSIIALVRLRVAPPETRESRLLISILVLAPCTELLLILCGLYAYANPSPVALPLWLWAYWLVAFLALKGIFDRWERRVRLEEQPS